MDLHHEGQLAFFGDLEQLGQAAAFADWLAPFRRSEWVVYAKPPFGGPEAVLAYLSRYTHRVAISNTRLVSADAQTVALRWKNYRIKRGDRQQVMRLATPEFIRRFLTHVLPDGFHRIRHYGLLASPLCKANISKIRALLCVQRPEQPVTPRPEAEIIPLTLREPCPCQAGDVEAPSRRKTGRSCALTLSVVRHQGPQPLQCSLSWLAGTRPKRDYRTLMTTLPFARPPSTCAMAAFVSANG